MPQNKSMTSGSFGWVSSQPVGISCNATDFMEKLSVKTISILRVSGRSIQEDQRNPSPEIRQDWKILYANGYFKKLE
jgi:hypothetical protein